MARVLCLGLCLAAVLRSADLDPRASRKLEEAGPLLAAAWTQYFRNLVPPPEPPRVIPITRAAPSACGRLPSGNAYYCRKDHSIYYDTNFLESLRRRIANVTGTRADAVPVVVLAHEFGHAVYAEISGDGGGSRPYQRLTGYGQEKMADCFAGAVTRSAYEAGLLDSVNLEEAGQTMIAVGEPRTFTWRYFGRHKSGYPDWRIRRDSFLSGFRNGAQSCDAASIENLNLPRR
ncbi:MAG: neutral zinc metallopeptidase [Bryobacterales bacterium]|nr:neutral zinc metallopeptidase [Bryobacterales bacterium]